LIFQRKIAVHRVKNLAALLVALSIFMALPSERAMAREVDEYAVKAAFVLNFVRFTLWPENQFTKDTDSYRLCFMGNTNVAKEFAAINGKKNGERNIYVHDLSSGEEYSKCDIVFISRKTDPEVSKQIISKTKGKPVLIIGETKEFIKQGGVINFFSKGNRLHFEINTRAAEKQGLKLSSRLLKLAVIVDGLQ